ncbi:hypothetical protein PO909_010910 [Leuciscus waleckii]
MPWAQDQCFQEHAAPQPADNLPGNSNQFCANESVAHARLRSLDSAASGFVQAGLFQTPQNVSEGVGPDGLSIVSTPTGPTAYASPSALVKTLSPGSCVATRPLMHQGEPRLYQSPGPLESHRLVPVWCEHGCGPKEKSDFNRHLQPGLGSSVRGQPVSCLLSSSEKRLYINCLEMRAVFLALKTFLPDLAGHHVLVRTDNMSVVSYINRQGGTRSFNLYTMAKHLLLWAHSNLRSLRAAHVLGILNQGADMLSRGNVPPEEWSLHPQTVQLIWSVFGRADLDLFASKDNSHCPTFFSKDRDALAHEWPSLPLYAFPPVSMLPQVIKRIREHKCAILLIAPLWKTQIWFPELARLLETLWPIPLRRDLLTQANRTICHPRHELWALHGYFGITVGRRV